MWYVPLSIIQQYGPFSQRPSHYQLSYLVPEMASVVFFGLGRHRTSVFRNAIAEVLQSRPLVLIVISSDLCTAGLTVLNTIPTLPSRSGLQMLFTSLQGPQMNLQVR